MKEMIKEKMSILVCLKVETSVHQNIPEIELNKNKYVKSAYKSKKKTSKNLNRKKWAVDIKINRRNM